jgi:pimeloyl-ACP methyl ester carboxylesterase/predicted glycosyltransferase
VTESPSHGPDRRAAYPLAWRPDRSGVVVREGLEVAWSAYGETGPAVVLLPTWSIVDSRFWKAQIGYLARHFRVVRFDGRGTGASSRPREATAYTDECFAEDAVAVMDAVGFDRAVLVGYSAGAPWALHVAAAHPDRVAGVFAIGPAVGFARFPGTGRTLWQQPEPGPEGWPLYNKHFWRAGGFDAFRIDFFTHLFSDPHSTKPIEDFLDWSREIDPETLIAANDGRLGLEGATRTAIEPLLERIRCPVTVLHGSDDRVNPLFLGEELARLTGGSLIVLPGVGHGPSARYPVRVNREIRRFTEQVQPAAAAAWSWIPAAARPPRVLYVSSPIGLGHARRDLAIADELRRRRPEIQVDWLAQHPVTRVLSDAGESVHPASAHLASESGHIEAEAGEHDLHAFASIRRMYETLVHNFGVFDDLVRAEPYDLVVADEAWDLDYFLHENPELKRFGYAWFTDFVGWLPMPDGGPAEAALTADYNAEMLEQRARYRRLRDRSIFVGNPEDVVPDEFGPGLGSIRAWTEQNFDFAGYVTGFDPVTPERRTALRQRHGYRDDERVCIVAVGGSGVGHHLLRRVLAAVPVVRRAGLELRFVVVCGPRIDPDALPLVRGADVVGYLPHLDEHLAACDVAVVQGGLTTTMELTAANRPFLYVPLRHHFEQNFHVRHRLDRYGAGTWVDYEQACDPDALAAQLIAALGREVTYRPVETDGAQRAAALLADLL